LGPLHDRLSDSYPEKDGHKKPLGGREKRVEKAPSRSDGVCVEILVDVVGGEQGL